MNIPDIRRRLVIQEISNKSYPSRDDIINTVKKQLAAFEELKGEEQDYPISTFNKDKAHIKNTLRCEIQYHKREDGYSITFSENSFFSNDMFSTFLFLSALNKNGVMPDYIIPDDRKNTGLNHFSEISIAIENKQKVDISYFKYDTQSTEEKTIYPYKLKQKDFRWYVLAKEEGDARNSFKSFALERIKSLHISSEEFRPENIDFETPFEGAFGMFTNGEVEKVVFEVDKRDGNYLKSNPIHSSQKIVEKENAMEFTLNVKPTLDLIMELMKRTWSIEIKEPTSLRQKFREYYQEALERNK